MDKRAKKIKEELQVFAEIAGVRASWHEPDEQEVSAIVTGTHLDNAMGIHQDNLPSYQQEYVVHLAIDGQVEFSINLADLLAIAAA